MGTTEDVTVTAKRPRHGSDLDTLTLTVNGTNYGGWETALLERQIDRMSSSLALTVTEKWAGQDQPWQINRFDLVVARIGHDIVLTGFVDEVSPRFDIEGHGVGLTVVSKTQNLVDCSPDIPSGQYRGYTLEAIARSICGMFDIDIVVQADCSQTFPDATMQRCETAFTFLERLGRLAGVLLTDDPKGRLVLTTTGTTHASGTLVQGVNILSAESKLSAAERFSEFIVKGQRAIGSAAPDMYQGAGEDDDEGEDAPAEVTPAATQLRAVATDASVPFFRPHVSLAEAQLDDAGMQRRANWERNYAFGRSTQVTVTVVGFRQPDGSMWQLNQLATVKASYLQLDQDLLVVGVTYREDLESGRTTVLKLGPVEGYTPDPGEVKLHAKKGKKGRANPYDFSGAGGIG